jgi:hypothetical protein
VIERKSDKPHSGNSFQFFAKSLMAPRNFGMPLSSSAVEPSFHDTREHPMLVDGPFDDSR